jgi:cytochrome c-type protein NapB
LVCIGLGACAGAEAKEPRVAVPDRPGADKTAAALRAERRAYDGAPPTIPHDSFGIPCVDCHNERGIAVKEVGFAPPMPHAVTAGLSAISRCQQCHVFRKTDEVFAANRFVGLPQDLRRGDRMHAPAPPVMPHPAFMRENCQACHDGPAAREEIRTPHPERVRCGQCHAERTVTTLFEPALQGAAN